MVEKFAAKTAKRVDWNKWKTQFESFLMVEPRYAEDEQMKLNMLLALGGAELQELFKLVPKVKEEKRSDENPNSPLLKKPYTWAIKKLDKYYDAGSNIQLEWQKFYDMKQNEEERFEQYVVRLKAQAEYCEFNLLEEKQIIHQINKSARLSRVCTKALEPDMTLHKLAAYAAQQENVEDSKALKEKRSGSENHVVSAVYGNYLVCNDTI